MLRCYPKDVSRTMPGPAAIRETGYIFGSMPSAGAAPEIAEGDRMAAAESCAVPPLPPEARFRVGAGDGVEVSGRHQVRPADAVDPLELPDELCEKPYPN